MTLARHLSRLGLALGLSLATCLAHGWSDDPLILEKEKYFKKLDSPILGQFNVSFAYSDIKQAGSYKDKWRKLDGKSESAMRVNLKGLSDATMQRITNAAYEDFTTKMTQAGITLQQTDLVEGIPKWLIKEFNRYQKDGYPERQSHYEAYGAVESKTVPREGTKVLDTKFTHIVGLSAKELKKEVINVRYLLHYGYLDPSASKTENSFMNEVTLKTSVSFHPGIQVYWRSGADIYKNHKKKGSILINKHIGAPGDFGKITLVEESNWGKSYKELDIAVDEAAYEKLAIDALAQANTLIVDQIAKMQ